jgi:hypothetical protein
MGKLEEIEKEVLSGKVKKHYSNQIYLIGKVRRLTVAIEKHKNDTYWHGEGGEFGYAGNDAELYKALEEEKLHGKIRGD